METQRPYLREQVLPFELYWNALHCLRRMLLTLQGERGEISDGERRARRIGKTFENARACDTAEERNAVIAEALERIDDADERKFVEDRLADLLERAEEIDEQTPSTGAAVKEKQARFRWTDPQTGWQLPAWPDDVEYDFDAKTGEAIIRVSDDKTAGRMTERIRQHLLFFGLVISLSKQEETRLEQVEERKQRDELERSMPRHRQHSRKGGHRRSEPRQRLDFDLRAEQKPHVQPKIVLVARLTGRVRDGDNFVPAPQPDPLWYSRRREREQLDLVRRVIKKIEHAFETGEFPARASRDGCRDCPFKNGCQAYDERQRLLRGEIPVVTPAVVAQAIAPAAALVTQ